MVDILQSFGNSERDALAAAIVDGIVDENTKIEYRVEDLNQELDGGFGMNGLYPPVKGLDEVQNHSYEVADRLHDFNSKVDVKRLA